MLYKLENQLEFVTNEKRKRKSLTLLIEIKIEKING
jgi:hypothetical protein